MKVGEKVAVLDDAITGVIRRIEGDTVFIMSDLDFEMSFSKSELVVVDKEMAIESMDSKNINEILAEKEPKTKSKPKSKEKSKKSPPFEVDLHIQQLTNNDKRMSNYEMLNLQLDTAKRQLEFAFQKKIQRIIFIHGVGQGVLRAELEFLLKRYDNLKFQDADYQKYGNGALEVYIFQNKRPNYP
ncbi:MAG: Smr/MutS family protein [Flavobacteriaceae bacterium]|nr:Smr/MutS family protein [Flavobacteriaceae bacterium]